jgi:hypothetical protein
MERTADPPRRLPKGLRGLWRKLRRAEESAGTRAELSRRLGISTHTLQRLLVDGAVPRFGRGVSTRQTLAWTRTLARLAARLDASPRAWIESAGIRWNDEVARACDEALRSVGGADPRRSRGIEPPEFRGRPSDKGAARDVAFVRSLARELAQAMRAQRDAHPAHCRSCSQPLLASEDPSPDFCRYCADEDGRLRPREEVHAILARWIGSWQPGVTSAEASRRALLYMSAMPAWTEESRSPEA